MSAPGLDETDRRLINALQIEPRASWNEIAPVIGVDAATLARRWARLREDGVVWVTGYATGGHMALLEVECDLAELDRISDELQRDRNVFVLDHSSGSRDLLALVRADDLGALSRFAVRRLGGLAGVRSVRTHLANEVLIEGASWRLRALSPEEAARIPTYRPPRPRASRRVADDLRHAIAQELWIDGRMPIATIAERTGFAPQRISDAIATLRQRGELGIRTDIARGLSGWPIYTWYFVEAPARTIAAARTAITAVPEVRLALSAASRYNLILAVWLRNLADVNRFEMALESALEGSRIADRAVVLRIAKHMSQAIGPDTRATGPANDVPSWT